MAEPAALPCITCHQEIEPQHQAFTVAHDGGCVCTACWDAEPGIDTTGERFASHKAVKRYMLEHDGDWWVPAPVEPGKAHMFAIVTVTPPPATNCVHCGVPIPIGQLAAEHTVAGTPLLWQAAHCFRCYELNEDCPNTCVMLDAEPAKTERSTTHA